MEQAEGVPSPSVPQQTDEIVRLLEEAEEIVTSRWRARVISRLAEKLEKVAVESVGHAPLPDSERAALGLIRGMADTLREGSAALLEAAEELKRAGRAYRSARAHEAGIKLARTAEELISG